MTVPSNILTQGVDIALLPHTWIWPDAAARTSQVVRADQVSRIGIQTDINLEYQLLSIGPTRWGPLPDPSMGLLRYVTATNNAAFIRESIPVFTAFGTITPRLATDVNAASRLTRFGTVTAAAAGSIGSFRSNTLSGFSTIGGGRYRTQFVLGAVSPTWRWFAGLSNTVPVANVNPNTFVSCFGVGRGNGEANVQLFHNDAAGIATQIDLGAAFPAETVDSAYEFEFYTFDGTSISYQFTNLSTGDVVSGIVTLDIPPTVYPAVAPLYYSSNNTDAVQVSLDFANLQFWQRVA